jgi:ClpP class serine protease
MVNEIYSDFIRIVSKERKIETRILKEDIGALIFTSDQASALNLIDDELNLEELVNKIINDNNLKDYRVIKSRNTNNSLLRQILSNNLNKKNHNLNFECLSLRSSMTAILSFESTGC